MFLFIIALDDTLIAFKNKKQESAILTVVVAGLIQFFFFKRAEAYMAILAHYNKAEFRDIGTVNH